MSNDGGEIVDDYHDARDDTPDTIETPDGTIHVTHDPDAVDVYATGVTVSMTEKVNLGNYENRELYANARFSIDPALALTSETETEVAKILEYGHGEVEAHIEAQVERAQEPTGEWE